jgi:hypothetical protein
MTRVITLVAALLTLAACSEPTGSAAVADRDLNDFTNFVWPVLIRDCGFHRCHGSQERFFRVYGPGRTRYDPMTDALDPSQMGYERDYTYQLALSMIDRDDPAQSLILRKPLAALAGGSSHEGVDKYGRNVYRTPDDEGYLQIAQWVFSEGESATPAAGATAPPVAGAPGL